MKLEPNKLLQVSVISFVIVEAISWILNKISPDIPFLKGGWIVFMFLLVIILTTLWTFGTNFIDLKIKDYIAIILILGIVIILYIVLPQVLPQLFSSIGIDMSSSNNLRDFLVKGIGSVIGVSSGVI